VLKRFRSLLRVLKSRRDFEQGMTEELRFHIEQYCAAASASGSSTIPPAILANLPASQPSPTAPAPSMWVSYLPFHNQQPLLARGSTTASRSVCSYKRWKSRFAD
jgi:hypothetical protein